MSAHTPGPWTAHDLDRNGFFPYVKMQTGEAYHNRLIINAPTGTDLKPTDLEPIRANARLIAAAPELLEALKRAAQFIEGELDVIERSFLPEPNSGEQVQLETTRTLLETSQSAIAKAEGRS